MAEKLYPSILEAWSVAECPFQIEYDPEVLEEIRRLAVKAFHSLPHGGAEIGGVLFGTYADGELQIRALWPMRCQHQFGPSFVLSEQDLQAMAALLESARQHPQLDGLLAAGWYHSHTRSEIFLSDKDLEIHDRFFPESWQIALVVRPNTLEPTRAGFFFRGLDGRIRCDRSFQEIVLRPVRRKTPASLPEPDPPEEAEAKPADPVEDRLEEPAEEPVAALAVLSPPPPPMPGIQPKQKPQVLPWALAGVACVAAVVLSLANTKPAVPVAVAAVPLPPALHLMARETDGELEVRWDRAAGPVRTATSGRLEFQDGGATASASLNPEHLLSGTFTYGRQSERVDIRLILQEPDGSSVQEATGFYGKPMEQKPGPEEQQLREQVEELKTQLRNEKRRADEEKRRADELGREVSIQRHLLRRK